MRGHSWMIAAALVVALPMSAGAQTTTTTITTTTQTKNVTIEPNDNHWVAAGFVGSNFGAKTDGSSVDVGGSLGYLWNDAVGAEFMAGFSPNFELQNSGVLLGEKPQVNSYMFNAIGALPLGFEARWQPFISGGLGAITLRADVLSGNTGDPLKDTVKPDDTKFGGNVGFGVMGFAGNWGLRGDVRYFRAFTDNSTPASTQEAIASNLLSGLSFWRANIGVAVRW